MENFNKNFNFPFKFILVHSFLYFISYGIALVNYYIIVPFKYKTFFISYFTIISLELIFLSKLLCLFKSSYDSTDNIKCILLIYSIMSIISLIFVSIEYVLIFKNIKEPNCQLEMKYKIPVLCISLLYYMYNNLIFIYEGYIVLKGLKQCIIDRLETQSNERGGNEGNVTQSSEKAKKIESFVKEDTVYIIHGNLNCKSPNIDNIDIDNISNNINCDSKDKLSRNFTAAQGKIKNKNKSNIKEDKESNTNSKEKKDNINYKEEETKSNKIIVSKVKPAQEK